MVNFSDKNEEMSMEDILASIRKYVSEEDEAKKENKPTNQKDVSESDNVITLDQSHISEEEPSTAIELPHIPEQNQEFYEEKSTLSEQVSESPSRKSPFGKLADTIKTYNKKAEQNIHQNASQLTIDKFLSEIAAQVIQKWVDANLRNIVEEIVMREIEKIKSE